MGLLLGCTGGAGVSSLDDMIMNSIGAPGTAADALLLQPGQSCQQKLWLLQVLHGNQAQSAATLHTSLEVMPVDRPDDGAQITWCRAPSEIWCHTADYS